MPDGTVPSSTEALRAALSAARGSLERQLRTSRSDAAEDALRQVKSALRLLPGERVHDIPEIAWVEADQAGTSEPAVRLAKVETSLEATSEPAAGTSVDDLTRIRGIDDVLAKRLAALGIQRFAQIAAWQPEDVRAIADAMGLGRRFLAMGIVDQAIDLDRAREQARVKDQEPAITPTAEGLHSVAIWEPKASSALAPSTPLVRAPAAWKPLDGETLAAVLKVIRTKRPMNIIVPLGDVAPALAQPIYIATDYDAATELPRWRTGVLVPFVEAREAPDLTQLARAALRSPQHHAQPAASHRDAMAAARSNMPREAANAIAAFHAAVAAATPPSPPAEAPPLHEQAATRIDTLEAELEQMAWRPAAAPSAKTANPESVSASSARRVAEPPVDGGDQTFSAQGSLRDDVPEADVKIVVGTRDAARPGHRAKAPLLAPLPELPLTARPWAAARVSAETSMEPFADARQSYGHVEEAAVVIVRRNTPEPAAADLAFYTQSRPSTGPVRRFMRALAGV